MNVRLVIESAPHAQAETERVFTGGRMVIGRSDDADWPLHDPDMYVSRQHCILTEADGRVMITDASSSGLFVDNAANPVGAGKVIPIEPGMRLRMGDIVMRVEAFSSAGPEPRKPETAGGLVFDFGRNEDEPPPPEPAPRPKDLPDPFGLSSKARSHERPRAPTPPKPLDQEDVLGLDLRKPFDQPEEATTPQSEPAQKRGGYFTDTPTPPASPSADTPATAPVPKSDIFADWDGPEARPAPPAEAPPAGQVSPAPEPPPPPPESEPPAPLPEGAERDIHTALLRGMGLDPTQFTGDPAQQAERIGRAMRLLVDGLMQQLRTRAQAKQKARVAQTIIASSDVNPLKFLATPEDVLASFVQPRGRGYLGPEEALDQAFRDLTDHQLRIWTALQAALRRMIDRFDPEEIEKAMADVGLLESLIAGGRSAKLWRLYEERYRDIARSAEDQFLGEVGADFRDAYESGRRTQDDKQS